MEVVTDSAKVREGRRSVLALMEANHPADCLTCDSNGRCEFQAGGCRRCGAAAVLLRCRCADSGTLALPAAGAPTPWHCLSHFPAARLAGRLHPQHMFPALKGSPQELAATPVSPCLPRSPCLPQDLASRYNVKGLLPKMCSPRAKQAAHFLVGLCCFSH